MRFPEPIPTPKSSSGPLNWGILAPGQIAEMFTAAVKAYGTQQISAVASRSLERARAFASKFSIDRAFGSYDDLFSVEEIEAVYISSHIDGHLELADQALEAGKHVLVEKPVHYSPIQARNTLNRAREKGLLMTEAMWTRYLPQASVVRQIIQSDAFGKPENLVATFAVDNRGIPRLWQPGTGGIVFDMGIYPISFAHEIFGMPSKIDVFGSCTEGGLDREAVVRLEYPSGATANLIISGVSSFPCTATVSGEKLALTLEHPFFVPTSIRLSDKSLYPTESCWSDGSEIRGHSGLVYQTEWFAHYVEKGYLESPIHTHAEIVSNLEVAEEVCKQLGSSPSLNRRGL